MSEISLAISVKHQSSLAVALRLPNLGLILGVVGRRAVLSLSSIDDMSESSDPSIGLPESVKYGIHRLQRWLQQSMEDCRCFAQQLCGQFRHLHSILESTTRNYQYPASGSRSARNARMPTSRISNKNENRMLASSLSQSWPITSS